MAITKKIIYNSIKYTEISSLLDETEDGLFKGV